jgi:hypothetical protein
VLSGAAKKTRSIRFNTDLEGTFSTGFLTRLEGVHGGMLNDLLRKANGKLPTG